MQYCVTDFPTNEKNTEGRYPFDTEDECNKWYVEVETGNFILRRGTNKNESLLKRLNEIWPERCGFELGLCSFT